jgi:hypothetical protein
MSQHSPQSSAGQGPTSSPFAGTDPTLYSPELARDTKHRRTDSISTIVGRGGKKAGLGVIFEKSKTLPEPPAYTQGAFVNEVSEDDPDFISRFQLVTRLPDGTSAGLDVENELFAVQHQMKLVNIRSFLLHDSADHNQVRLLRQLRSALYSRRLPPL